MVADSPSIGIALVWAQFAAYHVDRCEAVAQKLAGRARVLAVEVATSSAEYAWEPSGDLAHADKVTLFPGAAYEAIPRRRRILALFRTLRHCDWVFIGLSYTEIDVVLLAWLLRLCGVRLVIFNDAKFDDKPRRIETELIKPLLLACYHAAIVGGQRHRDYFRFLGFRQRPVLTGYDGVCVERVRRQSGGRVSPEGPAFETRPFIFVGRFVAKKNLTALIDAYGAYVGIAGAQARHLILVGSGPEEPELRARISALGLDQQVQLPGFLSAPEVTDMLADALALLLVSREEQWGLVVNEALAAGLPVIVSAEVGARDTLVRSFVNGYVLEADNPAGIARAMLALGSDRGEWERMVAASHDRAALGDTRQLAAAIESLLFP